MKQLERDEQLAKLSTDELLDLGDAVLGEIRLRIMETAGDLVSQAAAMDKTA